MIPNENGYCDWAGKLSILTGLRAPRARTAAIWLARSLNSPRSRASTWHGARDGSATAPQHFLLSGGQSSQKIPAPNVIFVRGMDSAVRVMRRRRNVV